MTEVSRYQDFGEVEGDLKDFVTNICSSYPESSAIAHGVAKRWKRNSFGFNGDNPHREEIKDATRKLILPTRVSRFLLPTPHHQLTSLDFRQIQVAPGYSNLNLGWHKDEPPGSKARFITIYLNHALEVGIGINDTEGRPTSYENAPDLTEFGPFLKARTTPTNHVLGLYGNTLHRSLVNDTDKIINMSWLRLYAEKRPDMLPEDKILSPTHNCTK